MKAFGVAIVGDDSGGTATANAVAVKTRLVIGAGGGCIAAVTVEDRFPLGGGGFEAAVAVKARPVVSGDGSENTIAAVAL